MPDLDVRLPAELAQRAVSAWRRDDEADLLRPEPLEQRVTRHRAATLALIGLAIEQRGRVDGDVVVVDLSAELAGLAMDAADHTAEAR